MIEQSWKMWPNALYFLHCAKVEQRSIECSVCLAGAYCDEINLKHDYNLPSHAPSLLILYPDRQVHRYLLPPRFSQFWLALQGLVLQALSSSVIKHLRLPSHIRLYHFIKVFWRYYSFGKLFNLQTLRLIELRSVIKIEDVICLAELLSTVQKIPHWTDNH